MNEKHINTIVFTGIDGSGKSTLIDNLYRKLNKREEIQLLRCPSYHKLSNNGVNELSILFTQINNLGNEYNQNDIKALGLFLQMSIYSLAIEHKSFQANVDTIISERHPVIDTAVYGGLYTSKIEGQIDPSKWYPILKKELNKSFRNGFNKVEIWFENFCKRNEIDVSLWRFTGYMRDMLAINPDLLINNLEKIFSVKLPNCCYFIDTHPEVAYQRLLKSNRELELHETVTGLTKLRNLYCNFFETIMCKYPFCKINIISNNNYLQLKLLYPNMNSNTSTSYIPVANSIRINRRNDLTREGQNKRLDFLEKAGSTEIFYLRSSGIDPSNAKFNIENFIGFTQTPVGIVGPVKVTGNYAIGNFYVPLATTEGALVMSYQRGTQLLKHTGGVRCIITKDSIQRAVLIELKDVNDSQKFLCWCNENLDMMRELTKKTSGVGRLLNFQSFVMGKNVILRFEFTTGDAMGMNMITKAVYEICSYMSKQYPIHQYLLECNMAVDKKPSYMNLINGRGKTVIAEALIQGKLVKKFLKVTAERLAEAYNMQIGANIYAGVLGANYQLSNGLAAIFLACGQDLANIAESSTGITTLRLEGSDIYISLTLPALIVGTVGGGTSLPTQTECLKIVGCYGNGKAQKFAEIIAATLLAGELSLAGSIAANDFAQAHEKYGRNGHKYKPDIKYNGTSI